MFLTSLAALFFLEDEGRIVYDEKAIDALLDRSNEGIVEKETGMDDYLSSFKVCTFMLTLNYCGLRRNDPKEILIFICTSSVKALIDY